jgi:hypothetical protein
MAQLFTGTTLVDIVLVFMALETAILASRRLLTGQGIPVFDVFVLMLPGACLVLAMRAALAGAPWTILALCMAAALVTHVADLWRRHARTP